MLSLRLWGLDKLMEDKIHKIFSELDYGSAYTLPISTLRGSKSDMIFGYTMRTLYTVFRPFIYLNESQKRLGRPRGTARLKQQGI